MRTRSVLKIEGLDELKAALKELPEAYKGRVIRDVHREALKGIKGDVRKKSPVKSLSKARMWSVQNDRSKKRRNPTAVLLGPTVEAYKLRWIERGTQTRRITTGVKDGKKFKKGSLKGANRGRITARPFIEREYVAQAKGIVENIKPVYEKQMEKVLKKNRVRIGRKMAAIKI